MEKTITVYGIKVTVRDDGQIISYGKIRKHHLNHDGYPQVYIGENRSIAVHRLVAIAFVPNPYNKPEVNHKDFDRTNFSIDNLEWVTHEENVRYSANEGHYVGKFGEDNPNYGNTILHERYMKDKEYALEKQSRKGGRNGKAKKCALYYNDEFVSEFSYQREAVDYLVLIGVCNHPDTVGWKETIINVLRNSNYKGYTLKLR